MMAHLSPIFGMTDVGEDAQRMLDELVDILFERFYYEKCTAFILFCAKCRAREYKVAYGTIKLDAILEAANDFLHDKLPVLKHKAGAEVQRNEKRGDIVECNAWKFCTKRSLFKAWYEGTLRLIREKGDRAVVESIVNDDEYHLGIAALIGIGAMDVEHGRIVINSQAYHNHMLTLEP